MPAQNPKYWLNEYVGTDVTFEAINSPFDPDGYYELVDSFHGAKVILEKHLAKVVD